MSEQGRQERPDRAMRQIGGELRRHQDEADDRRAVQRQAEHQTQEMRPHQHAEQPQGAGRHMEHRLAPRIRLQESHYPSPPIPGS